MPLCHSEIANIIRSRIRQARSIERQTLALSAEASAHARRLCSGRDPQSHARCSARLEDLAESIREIESCETLLAAETWVNEIDATLLDLFLTLDEVDKTLRAANRLEIRELVRLLRELRVVLEDIRMWQLGASVKIAELAAAAG